MGGSKSKSAVESLTSQINDIAMNTVQDCLVQTGQKQVVSASNAGWQFGNAIRIAQTTSVSSQCFMNSQKQVDLQNKIYQAVKNTADASGVAVLSAIGSSKSEADTKLITMIRNSVTMQNIQKNYNIITQTQEVTIKNESTGVQFINSIDISQGAEVFAAATLKTVNDVGIINALTTSIDNQSKATTENPLEFISRVAGNIAGAIGSSFTYIAIAVVVILGIIAYTVVSGGAGAFTDSTYADGTDANSTYPDDTYADSATADGTYDESSQ